MRRSKVGKCVMLLCAYTSWRLRCRSVSPRNFIVELLDSVCFSVENVWYLPDGCEVAFADDVDLIVIVDALLG